MTNSEERKRAYVYDLYPGPRWKKRVQQMPDDQITAIYLKHQRDGQPPEHNEAEPLDLEIEPGETEAARLVDVPRQCGPHANEDEFQTY